MKADVTELYSPPDTDQAYHEWRCTCGPAAVAAVLRRTCRDIRALFPGHEARGYANITHIEKALGLAGARVWKVSGLPRYGLAFLQITGPWTAPGVPVGAAYRHTHWIAHRGGDEPMVYDVNAPEGWQPLLRWEASIIRRILAAHPKSDGWNVRRGIEVGEADRA